MLEAELALEQGQPGEALARARRAQARGRAAHGGAAARAARAQRGAAARARSRRSSTSSSGARCTTPGRARWCARARRRSARRPRARRGGLARVWNRLSDADRCIRRSRSRRRELPRARRRPRSRRHPRAQPRARWDPALVALFGECRPADASRQLEIAERWLAAHSDDAMLLCALGRCASASGCGARRRPTTRRASRSTTTGARASMLGGLFVRLGRHDDANAQLAAALKLALAELGEPGLGESGQTRISPAGRPDIGSGTKFESELFLHAARRPHLPLAPRRRPRLRRERPRRARARPRRADRRGLAHRAARRDRAAPEPRDPGSPVALTFARYEVGQEISPMRKPQRDGLREHLVVEHEVVGVRDAAGASSSSAPREGAVAGVELGRASSPMQRGSAIARERGGWRRTCSAACRPRSARAAEDARAEHHVVDAARRSSHAIARRRGAASYW